MELNRQSMDFAFAHLARRPAVFTRVKDKLQTADFLTTEIVYRFVWSGLLAYYNRYNTLPTHEQFMAHLCALQELIDTFASAEDIDAVVELAEFCWTFPDESFNDAQALSIIEDWLVTRRVRARAEELANAPDVSDTLRELSDTLSQSRVAMPEEAQLFMYDDHVDYHTTGLSFLDQMFGGGYMTGACYGIIGPSGSGKTALATHMMVELARMGKHVFFYSFEQGTRAMRPRILAALVGAPVAAFNAPDQTARQAARKAQQVCGSYIHFFSMKGDPGEQSTAKTLADVEAHLRSYSATTGVKPDVFIIDWLLLPCVLTAADSFKLRRNVLVETNRFVQLAVDIDAAGFLVNQSAAASGGRAPNALPSTIDIAEARLFAWLLSAYVVLGKIDKETMALWAISGKARSADVAESMVLRLDPRTSRFYCADTEYEPDRRPRATGFMRIGDMSGNRGNSGSGGNSGGVASDVQPRI